jgi:hypothetical protein
MIFTTRAIRSAQLLSKSASPSTRLSIISAHVSPRPISIRAMSSLPKTMKAVYIEKTGGTEVLQYNDVPVPEPKEGEVLVKNEFIGINYIDT